MTELPQWSVYGLLMLLLLTATYASPAAQDASLQVKDFLYLGRNDSGPHIIDYNGTGEANVGLPSFLYSTDTGPRVVEFYAPWCPHCQRYRTHYIDYARQVAQFGEESSAEKAVQFFAVSCTAYRPICVDQEIKTYPTVKIYAEGSIKMVSPGYPKSVHPFDLFPLLNITTSSQGNVDREKIADSKNSLAASALKAVGLKKPSFERSKQQMYNDIHLSFDLSMRNVYSSKGPLQRKEAGALQEWLELLKVCLPREWPMKSAIRDLLEDFDKTRAGEDHLLAVLDRYPPRKKEWSRACTKDKVGMGFTCGLWELFHVMSMGILEWNNRLDSRMLDTVSAIHAGTVLRNFIENFFGCEECRSNFIKHYDGCALDRCNRLTKTKKMKAWTEFPLWLFETHNAVNVRLLREQAERENREVTKHQVAAARWPSREACQGCWKGDTYDANMVLKFLRSEYWYVFASRRDVGSIPHNIDRTEGVLSRQHAFSTGSATSGGSLDLGAEAFAFTSVKLMQLSLSAIFVFIFGRRCLRQADRRTKTF